MTTNATHRRVKKPKESKERIKEFVKEFKLVENDVEEKMEINANIIATLASRQNQALLEENDEINRLSRICAKCEEQLTDLFGDEIEKIVKPVKEYEMIMNLNEKVNVLFKLTATRAKIIDLRRRNLKIKDSFDPMPEPTVMDSNLSPQESYLRLISQDS